MRGLLARNLALALTLDLADLASGLAFLQSTYIPT